MAKKMTLQKQDKLNEIKMRLRPRIPVKAKTDLFSCKLFLSQFVLTDNLKFVFFNIPDQFVLDNIIQDNIIKIDFNEEALDMRINRNVVLVPNPMERIVIFQSMGQIDLNIYQFIMFRHPKCVFHPVIEWFGQAVNTLICCLSEKGKPVAVVKTLSPKEDSSCPEQN